MPATAQKRLEASVARRACALTIAGLDPGGGAGIAADLRAFAALGAWGCAACSCLTVQSTSGLVSVHPTDPALLRAQIDEVVAHQRVRAIKTGALASTANVEVVLALRKTLPAIPLVVDPVIVATRSPEGARLLDDRALEAMLALTRQATVVTPNIDEAEALLRSTIRDFDDQRAAAAALVEQGATAALVKGGHLATASTDVLALRQRSKIVTIEIASPRVHIPPFHGGGCTLASLITALLVDKRPGAATIEAAVKHAKKTLAAAIVHPLQVGKGLLVLDPPTPA